MLPGPKPKRDGPCCTPNCMVPAGVLNSVLPGVVPPEPATAEVLRLLLEVEFRNLVVAVAVRGLAAEREGPGDRRRQHEEGRQHESRGQSAQMRDFQTNLHDPSPATGPSIHKTPAQSGQRRALHADKLVIFNKAQ